MFTAAFWKGAIERAVRVAATSALGLFGADQVITGIDFKAGAAVVATAVVLDLLASLVAASPAVPGDGPSLTQAEQTTATPATPVVPTPTE